MSSYSSSSSSSLNPLSPYIPVPVQALIISLKVSNFAGGVHGHQAIVYFLPQVTTVDHGALPWSTLNNAICCISVSRAHARGRGCACERYPGELTDLQRNSQPPVPSLSKCAYFKLASLLLICTKSNLAESARCYSSVAGRVEPIMLKILMIMLCCTARKHLLSCLKNLELCSVN